jgi:hypothetical protein
MADLIDLNRARQNLPSVQNTDEPLIATLITAVSRQIQKYCRRDFVQAAYDELYNGNGDRRLLLPEYPIVSVQSVRYRPVTVLKAINNLANTPQARVSVNPTGLTLQTVTAGVALTQTVSFASNPTLLALVSAINALGNGWSAQSTGYDQWPSADLRTPQGALTAAGQYAELKLHTYELAGYQIDETRGWLLRAIPYTDPELLHPEDLIWPVGINNFRIQYTAGYATVPEGVQEACAEWVALLFNQTNRDPGVTQQKTLGTLEQAYSAAYRLKPPPVVAMLLAPYVRHSIHTDQG